MKSRRSVLAIGLSAAFAGAVKSADPPNLNRIAPDLIVPPISRGDTAAGKRVIEVTPGWESTPVRHCLYLPTDWRPDRNYPVLVEFPGNGGFRNALGDVSDGTPEGCQLGYGLSGGSNFIWISLPFVEINSDGSKRNCTTWWGNVEETKKYCTATVRDVCEKYGGEATRVVLCGFSRGSIACNYIGLNDDLIAGMWRAFFCHSHYDGVRQWPYADSDPASALTRIRRLKGRPQWISHELDIEPTRRFITTSGIHGSFRFVPIPYPNHTAAWVLRDIPERRQARKWLTGATRPVSATN